MRQYPRDEFDEIDENTARRGAYRGRQEDTQTSSRGLLAMVLSGVLALVVGGFMYVNSPRTASPEAASQASASASATASPSAESGPTVDPTSVTVEVYNSSAPEGAASVATQLIEAKGYTVRTTENWAGTYTLESAVNFATGASSEANEIADALGLPYIVQDYEADSGLIYVVLGADFDPTSFDLEDQSSAETSEEQSSAAADETASEASAEPTEAASAPAESDGQVLYTVDPATGAFVEATEATSGQTLYTYDATTGGYQEYNPQQGDGSEQSTATTYSYDATTGTFVEDPAGTFIFDAATGTYVQR